MKRRWIGRGLKFFAFAIVGVSVLSAVVMTLWNWLMPALFGLPPLGFWQALGLLALSRILFGGFRGRPGGHRMHWRHRVMERWEHMTPEERDEFKKGVRGGLRTHCGPLGPPEPEPKG